MDDYNRGFKNGMMHAVTCIRAIQTKQPIDYTVLPPELVRVLSELTNDTLRPRKDNCKGDDT